MKLLSFLAGLLAVAASAQAQNYAIDWFTIDGGGGTSAGGGYSLSGTVGQPDAGTSSGGAYSLVGGFWGIGTVPPPPLLYITNSGSTVVVSWDRPATGFFLEQTGVLTAPPAAIPWSTVPASNYQTNATRIFITVPMATGNSFYRLRWP